MSAEDVGRSISVQDNALEPVSTRKNEKNQFLRKFIKVEILSMYRRRINFILEE